MSLHQKNPGTTGGIRSSLMQVPGNAPSPSARASKGQSLSIRTVPVEFGRIVLQWAAEKGVDIVDYLAGVDIPPELMTMEDTRIPVSAHQKLVERAIALTGSVDGVGYELGMRIGLTTHALSGYALLSQLTLREAIRFGVEYSPLVIPAYRGRLVESSDQAAIIISLDFTPDAVMHHYLHDMALTAVWKGLRNLIGEVWPDVELWFDYPEPEYFPRYRDQLPVCRFDMGSNRICFPASQLDRRIRTGDPVMARLMVVKFQEERIAQCPVNGIIEQVGCELVSDGSGYPSIEVVSDRLCMSERTLKRKLRQAGTSFQKLLAEVRYSDSTQLLSASTMSIDDIAAWVGYGHSSNFSNAFRRWMRMTPSEFRLRMKSE